MANCTSHIQPADAGIIKSFKSHYTNVLISFFIDQLCDEHLDKLIMPDVKQCMSMIKHAWSEVSQETIVNCWKKCKIIKNNYLDTEIQNLMNIDYSCIVSKLDYKLKILNLNKFKYQPINAETLIFFKIGNKKGSIINFFNSYFLILETNSGLFVKPERLIRANIFKPPISTD